MKNTDDGWVTDPVALRTVLALGGLQLGDGFVERLLSTGQEYEGTAHHREILDELYRRYNNAKISNGSFVLVGWRRPCKT